MASDIQKPVLVIALGGNALLKRGEPLEAENQRQNVSNVAEMISRITDDWRIVVTHGNGPQIGLLALQAAADQSVKPYPLDVLGAESEGMIGYMIQQELTNFLPDMAIATLLTQVSVDPEDAAFGQPDKPIGPTYSEEDARRLSSERGWAIARDGDGFRRVVASPEPRQILELDAIELLLKAGVLVICAGGGGIPVFISEDCAVRGIEAVIDKDRSSALLALELGAERLVILTDVDAVYTDWGQEDARAIRIAGPNPLGNYDFEPGTMSPKVEAACRFVETSGHLASIGALEDLPSILVGKAGTQIRPGTDEIEWYDE